jgi:hypothetical protein
MVIFGWWPLHRRDAKPVSIPQCILATCWHEVAAFYEGIVLAVYEGNRTKSAVLVLKDERMNGKIGEPTELPLLFPQLKEPFSRRRENTKRVRTVQFFLLIEALLIGGCKDQSTSTSDHPSSIPPTQGLVAYYPCNGDGSDQSGNGINGVLHGPTPTDDRFGRTLRAYIFDGVGNSISIPHSAKFDMGNNYSISLWFKLLDVSITRTLAAKNKTELGVNDYLNLSISQATGLLTASVGDGSVQVTASSTKRVNDNLWHHTVVMVGSSIQLWIDGQLSNQVPQSIVAKQNSDSLIIGSWQGRAPFKGSIDDIRIYNRGLIFSEITALYNEE